MNLRRRRRAALANRAMCPLRRLSPNLDARTTWPEPTSKPNHPPSCLLTIVFKPHSYNTTENQPNRHSLQTQTKTRQRDELEPPQRKQSADINECEIPSLRALCSDNSECVNLPGHFVCKCKPGYQQSGLSQSSLTGKFWR